MKKMIAFATAASLALGSMGTVVYAETFADINTVTWQGAATFINEAASLGLMSGYSENGKKYCKPRNNVTYCEAVQLMYSIMKTYSKQDVSAATVTKWKQVMSGFGIPEWAYNATAYALENGILDSTAAELNNLRGGTKYASREAVGVIFGKALDTISGYDTVSNPTLTYQDAAKISASAKPYLELLNRAGLMVGDTDNKFNPQNNITRAEMAVLSVKSYKKIADTQTTTPTAPQSGTMAGTVVNSMVMSNGDLFLSLKDGTGAGLNLFADVDTVKPIYQKEQIKFSDIGTGDTVKVTYSGTQISAIEVTNSVKGIRLTETYELVKLTESKVTVQKTSSTTEEYRLSDDVKVYLEGSKSTISKVKDAMENAKYDVTLTFNADEKVEKLEAKMNADNPTKGTLTALDESEIKIKVGSKSYTYPLTEGDLTIEQDGKSMTFAKLKNNYKDVNYTVSLKLDSKNEVTKISVESEEDETNGTLTFLNSRRIEIKAAGETYKYDVDAADVTVKIDGKSKTLEDLKTAFNDEDKSFTVELDVDRDGYATEILAISKNADADEGELKKLTNSKITITVDKKDIQYDLADDVDVRINSKNADLTALKENYEDIEFTVVLTFDKSGDVSGIKAEMEEPGYGKLKDINTDKDTLKIEIAGVTVELDLDDPTVSLDGKKTTLSKLDAELDYASSKSYITVELDYSNKGKVTEIEAEWVNDKDTKSTKGDLEDVNLKRNEITIVDNDGDSYDYEVSKDVVISYSFSSNTAVFASSNKFDKAYKEYDEDDLEGLDSFARECWKNNADCTVTLTVDSDGEVTRIKAKAE